MSKRLSGLLFYCLMIFAVTACTDSGGDVAPTPIPGDGTAGGDTPDDPSGGSGSGEYSVAEMLTAYVDEIVAPNYAALVSSAQAMTDSEGELHAYCDAIGTENESVTHSIAQDQWRTLASQVQRAELHAIGPAAENAFSLQYRLNSYMFGSLSTCGVDGIAALVDEDFDIANRSINQRGIGALEYLLFNETLEHSCPPQASATQSWNELSSGQRKSKRCEAAMLIAKDIAEAAEAIATRWDPSGGDFRAIFLAEDRLSESLQITTDGLFYIEEGAKDAKLGNPLGIIEACSSLTCPEQIESPFSRTSLRQIINNVKAFETIFVSNEATGFDAHIVSEGFPEVAQRFVDNLSETLALAESIDVSLSEQVQLVQTASDDAECANAFANPDSPSDRFPTCTLYGLIKRIVDDLKIDFVAIVNVSVPGGSQADND